MLADRILESKGREVATVRPDSTVREAVAVLAQKNIGALVVSPEGTTVVGIVSERDIVRRLGSAGAGALDLPVEELMIREVATCTPDTSTDDLMERMTEGRFRHVPVVDDGALVGIISIGDVVKVRIGELAEERAQLVNYIHASG